MYPPHLHDLGEQGQGKCVSMPLLQVSLFNAGNLKSVSWAHIELSPGSPGRAGGQIFYKNPLHCWDLNPQPPWYQADVLQIELSRVGLLIIFRLQLVRVISLILFGCSVIFPSYVLNF